MTNSPAVRLGVDIGGTFTDVALERGPERFTAKVLTTTGAPEEGVLSALRDVMGEANAAPSDVRVIIHGTTLATNALIERKGAKTALLTTEGFRDVIEIRHENRFEQYDVNIDLPPPLVPRRLRLPVAERVDAQGNVLVPLDEASVARALETLKEQKIEAVAVGFLHSFTNPQHERRTAELIARSLPHVAVTLSSDVSPEMREYERFSTACANAYLQPLMGRYLGRLENELARAGFRCPMLLMTSGGGIAHADLAGLEAAFAELEQQGRATLRSDGFRDEDIAVVRSLEMRYVGQIHECTVEIGDLQVNADTLPAIVEAFHRRHEALYTYAEADNPVEIVNLESQVIGRVSRPPFPSLAASDGHARRALAGSRPMLFGEDSIRTDTPVYQGALLLAGDRLHGPAVIEEATTNILIRPGWVVELHESGCYRLTRQR